MELILSGLSVSTVDGGQIFDYESHPWLLIGVICCWRDAGLVEVILFEGGGQVYLARHHARCSAFLIDCSGFFLTGQNSQQLFAVWQKQTSAFS